MPPLYSHPIRNSARTMLFLRLLGGPSLCGNGSTLTGPATQRHRLALLALLASSRSRPQSRDKLVAWLWPERDVEHARNLLNQGVHALRRAIGEAGIISVQDELRLDPAAVACDVVAFEDAIAAGELERAIGLYTGPFLDGFHLPGASEFEHWADGERDRLRRSYARSLESLAEAAEERREWSSAVERWRGLVSEEPYNARVTLRLMRALDGAGDRAGALQQARLHTLLLQQEFEAGPDPDVVALADRLRTEPANGDDRKVAAWSPDTGSNGGPPHAGISAPARVTTDQFASTADLAHRRSTEPRIRIPKPRTTATRSARAAAGWPPDNRTPGSWRDRRTRCGRQRISGAPDPPAQPTAIAILPFAYRGDPKFSYLSEGMADLLSARVDGAAGLRSIDQRALLTFLDRKGGIANSDHGRLAAERFGAGFFVLGSVVEAGGRLQLSATIYDERARPRSSVETVAGSEPEIFDAADRLARHILAGMQDRPTALAGVAGQTTSSLPALKAYLEGERELRSGRYAEAQEAFRRATELDTTFALAYYRLAMTLGPAPALEALDHALRHSDRLSEHHRWAVEAAAAYFRGDHTLADQRTRQVLTVRPDDAGAWFMYAVVTLSKGSLLGRAWVDAREGFERALALDPENADAVWWLSAIAATERRLPALDSLTNRLQQLNGPPWMARQCSGTAGDHDGRYRRRGTIRRGSSGAARSVGRTERRRRRLADRGSVGRAAPLAADHGAPPLAGVPDDGSRDAGKVRARRRPLGCREHGAAGPRSPGRERGARAPRLLCADAVPQASPLGADSAPRFAAALEPLLRPRRGRWTDRDPPLGSPVSQALSAGHVERPSGRARSGTGLRRGARAGGPLVTTWRVCQRSGAVRAGGSRLAGRTARGGAGAAGSGAVLDHGFTHAREGRLAVLHPTP